MKRQKLAPELRFGRALVGALVLMLLDLAIGLLWNYRIDQQSFEQWGKTLFLFVPLLAFLWIVTTLWVPTDEQLRDNRQPILMPLYFIWVPVVVFVMSLLGDRNGSSDWVKVPVLGLAIAAGVISTCFVLLGSIRRKPDPREIPMEAHLVEVDDD